MKRFCAYCGRVYEGEQCSCRPPRKRKPTANDKTRGNREPWRKLYSTRAFRAARQIVIERQRGRCADCGKVCATFDEKIWHTAGYGGEVDHVHALCDGGTNAPENLVLRCKSCHAKRDAKRRREEVNH